MKNKHVTVIVPTFNQEAYIYETLLSICQQDASDIDYDILVVDDTSKDATVSEIKKVQKEFSEKVNVIERKKNLVVVKNVFFAIQSVESSYIALCGGDDLWEPFFLSRQMKYIESNNLLAVYSKVKTINSIGESILHQEVGRSGATFDNLLVGNVIPACTAVVKTSLAKQYLKEIDPVSKCWLMEDYPFWLWIALNTDWGFNNQFLAKYRVLPESLSHSKSYKKRIHFSLSRLEVIMFYSEISDRKVSRKMYESYLLNRSAFSFCTHSASEIRWCRNEAYKLIKKNNLSLKLIFIIIATYVPRVSNVFLQRYWPAYYQRDLIE
jgi:glycosyltransferase involved in cell wall biosynthesis